jgi:hypothetical protein
VLGRKLQQLGKALEQTEKSGKSHINSEGFEFYLGVPPTDVREHVHQHRRFPHPRLAAQEVHEIAEFLLKRLRRLPIIFTNLFKLDEEMIGLPQQETNGARTLQAVEDGLAHFRDAHKSNQIGFNVFNILKFEV